MAENENPVIHETNASRTPAPWTPEDAARFLSSAIQEAQRPLAEALRRKSVSPAMFALVIAMILAASAGVVWFLAARMEKSEVAADAARSEREAAIEQRHIVQGRHDTLAVRIAAMQEQKLEQAQENERLRTEAVGHKNNEEELKRLRQDIIRYRRQGEILRDQIAGIEMEKQALSRQLSAVRALAENDAEIIGPAEPSENADAYVSAENVETPKAPESILPQVQDESPKQKTPAIPETGTPAEAKTSDQPLEESAPEPQPETQVPDAPVETPPSEAENGGEAEETDVNPDAGIGASGTADDKPSTPMEDNPGSVI